MQFFYEHHILLVDTLSESIDLIEKHYLDRPDIYSSRTK